MNAWMGMSSADFQFTLHHRLSLLIGLVEFGLESWIWVRICILSGIYCECDIASSVFVN